MSVTVKHPFISTVPDSTDTSLVRPSNWNADHTIVGLGTAELNAGVANGVASLDSAGTVPISQLPAAVLGALSYQGTWDASTNTPTLASSTGTKGYYYVVSVAGSTNLNGITDWKVGDWAVFNGSVWQKIDNTDAVTSVNGYTGAVVLTAADISGAANAPTNTNITSMTGVTGAIDQPTLVHFNTTYATALTEGQLGWDGNNTLGLGMAGGNVVQHIGEDSFIYTKASSAITKGQVVMFTGAVGASAVPTGAPATGVADGSYIMGVAAESIATNGFGLVQIFGTLRNVNTSTYADGEILWYNPAVIGGLTSTKPSAPNVKVQLAAVLNGGSVGGGSILIRVNAGSTLGGTDQNVQIGTPTSGNTLIYDATAGYWKNANISAGTGVSITNGAGAITVANTGVTSFSAGTTGLTPATGTNGAVTLAGTLAVANGGTGLISVTANRIPYGNGTSALQTSANLTFDGTTLTNTGNAIISDNSSNAALRITQVGVGNALLVEDSANPDATPFAVDGNGVLIVGNTASQGTVPLGDGARYTPQTQMQGIAYGTSGLSATLFNAAAASGGGSLALNKSNTNTLGGQAVVASGDVLGTVFFNGSDGTNFVRGAQIQAVVDGTPGTNDMPGRLVFSTTADGASSPTERMRIDNAGQVGIGVTPSAGRKLTVGGTIGGATSVYANIFEGTIGSDAIVAGYGFATSLSTTNAATGPSTIAHFSTFQGTISGGSRPAVTNQYGYLVGNSLTGATNNYGFYGNIASGTGRWNFYAAGTAANYLAGGVIINNNLGVGAAGSPSYGTSGQVLTSAGSGAAPTWSTPVSSNITAQGLFENANTISANYTIGTNNNAVSAGPITIASGVTVTVPSGSVWVVV